MKRTYNSAGEDRNPKVAKYETGANVVAAARDEVQMKPNSGMSSNASSRRSSMSMQPVSDQINAFKGNAYTTASAFSRSSHAAPLHPISHSVTPQVTPESSGGISAKVQTMLNEFKHTVDEKIERAVKPLTELTPIY